MPLTYIEIEKQKTWRIGMLFILLLFLYFLVVMSLIQGILIFFPFIFLMDGFAIFWGNPLYVITVLGFSLVCAAIHFWFSASAAVEHVTKNLEAVPPDPDDGIHRRLLNIVDEIHVVTGRRQKIACLVVPSLSMNALAVSDLKGNAAIAITEGLLSRLSRSQTEAVLAHEAAHILSGDCLEASVATSLFGMYAAMLEKLQAIGEEEFHRGLHPAFFPLWMLVKLSSMLSMFISREREYRADAASVRMTRNPLAMAEALQIISRNWRGSGIIAGGLEMLCIINPREVMRDESEGFWANLMSTHPPIRKRIRILLRMVHVRIEDFERTLPAGEETAEAMNVSQPLYYALNGRQQWQGPYDLPQLSALPWLSPLTWIKSGKEKAAERASEDPAVSPIFTARLSKESQNLSTFQCPVCRQSLIQIPYEKTRVYQCSFCKGALVESGKIPRIIARREKQCEERLRLLAEAVASDNQRKIVFKRAGKSGGSAKAHLTCAKCGHPMLRTFYSLAYLIEIDRCGLCNITWFDAEELEMLQCLIDNKLTAKLDFSGSGHENTGS